MTTNSLSIPESKRLTPIAFEGALDPQFSNRDDTNFFGIGPWDRGDQLTISFADDGTKVLNQQSSLFESFGWMLSEKQLQTKVLTAFQVWARTTNLNVGLVEDGGLEFGAAGLRQHDSRFGDIRIGAIDMAPDVFAVSIPADDLAAGSWAGEILFNSTAEFKNANHFYQVALHEAGHIFGLDHSDDHQSPMHPHGASIRITKKDVADLRAMYGFRGLDINEDATKNNNSIKKATDFEFSSDAEDGELPLVAFGDIRSGDSDYFVVNLPSDYSGRLSFRLKTEGLSLLSPRLTVYDENGQILRRRVSKSKSGDNLVVSMPKTVAGNDYYVRVDGSNSGIFGIGSYAIGAIMTDVVTVGWNKATQLISTRLFNMEEQDDFQEYLLDPNAFLNDDYSTDDKFSNAQILETPEGYLKQSHYTAQGSLGNPDDLDFFRIRAIGEGTNDLTFMNVVIDSLEREGLIPNVEIFDRNFNPVKTAVLVNSNGQYSVQARSIETDRNYYIKISANDASLNFTEGNYRLDVDFSDSGVSFRRFAAGTLNATNLVQEHTLHVARSQILHINTLSQRNLAGPNAIIWVTVYDEHGDVHFRSATRPGETRSANSVLFSPGSYAIKVELALPTGTITNSDFNYLVRGHEISDSQGPKLLDPTDSPFPQCKTGSPDYCYPNDNDSPRPYVFVDDQYVVIDSPVTPWVDINQWYWFDNWLIDEVPPSL